MRQSLNILRNPSYKVGATFMTIIHESLHEERLFPLPLFSLVMAEAILLRYPRDHSLLASTLGASMLSRRKV